MILDDHYALVFRPLLPKGQKPMKVIVTKNGWAFAQQMHKLGHIVVLECWHITTGKCISN